jgi:hypothetical protein
MTIAGVSHHITVVQLQNLPKDLDYRRSAVDSKQDCGGPDLTGYSVNLCRFPPVETVVATRSFILLLMLRWHYERIFVMEGSNHPDILSSEMAGFSITTLNLCINFST